MVYFDDFFADVGVALDFLQLMAAYISALGEADRLVFVGMVGLILPTRRGD